MRLQFVGCGDALGSGGRYNTCFHVQGDHVNFLIDCGASSLPALKRLDIARDELDLILITHFHGDHFAGLPFLLLDAQFSRRTRPLVIAGPQGIEQKLPQVMEALFEHSSQTKRRFDLSVVKNHLSLTTLEAHLAEIKPKRLILTHMSDDMLGQLDALRHTVAHDGMIVEL
jgi:ribonuclease BN (tRNA processing enzyme)